MKDSYVKIVCTVNNEYEIAFKTPFMEKDDAQMFCINFDDWSDFVENCFNPQVFIKGTKCTYDLRFYCSINQFPQLKEEMSL